MTKKIFQRTGLKPPKTSGFDLSREQKLTCNFGELIPTYIEEVLPGDRFRVKTESFIRMAPMIAPMMHRLNVHMHYFFVPNRLVWNEWEDFITGGKDGTSTPTIPNTLLNSALAVGTDPLRRLSDYMGLPQKPSGSSLKRINLLPFRAYQLIYNVYYRDPNLINEVDITDPSEALRLRIRSWEKDYFTSSLPWTQRGADVGVPVTGISYKTNPQVTSSIPPLVSEGITTGPGSPSVLSSPTGGFITQIDNLNFDDVNIDINDLRRSHALQRFMERQAIGGYRYTETVLSHFGIRSSDARLQRPEYLGGGKQPIVISEVLNTSATSTEPQGDLAGHGISVGETNSFQYSFEEHGYVIGILSIMPRTNYMQGVPKHFLRDDKFDYYWPELAHLGEQEVNNIEVFYDNSDDDYNDGVFGYQQRYAEYKYGCSSVHGDFRGNLDYWHMARKFAGQQSLNQAFVEYSDDERPFAVQDGSDKFWIQLYHDVKAIRPIPYFSNPKL